MATKIKVITARDFLEVTTNGVINIDTSRQLLIDIAKAEQSPADYELLVDFRGTQDNLSIMDIYQLAAELYQHGDTFRRKIALLVVPGINFEHARFFENCSRNRGFLVNAFTDYEKAMHWILSIDDNPDEDVLSCKTESSSGD
jgi:hypothetical protein